MGNITFLGVEGSGKTVLTMALVNLFKAHAQEGWFLRPETRSAFRFVEQVPPVLEPGSLPHQTTALRHLAMSVVKDGEVQRVFDILDYPGEIYRLAFLDAKDDPDPATFQARVEANQEEIRALLSHLQGSDRVYVLFNLADAQNLAHNAKNLDAVWVTNACLDYLHRLPSRPEIALLLTQIDLYGDLNNPTLSPRHIAEQAHPLITRNFPNLSIQAVSALGPASGPFGVDNILANCLKDTPAVQTYLALDLNEPLAAFISAANVFAQYPTEEQKRLVQVQCQAVIEAVNKFNQNDLWFMPLPDSIDDGGKISALLHDWMQFVKLYETCPETRTFYFKVITDFHPETTEGARWHQWCKHALQNGIHRPNTQNEHVIPGASIATPPVEDVRDESKTLQNRDRPILQIGGYCLCWLAASAGLAVIADSFLRLGFNKYLIGRRLFLSVICIWVIIRIIIRVVNRVINDEEKAQHSVKTAQTDLTSHHTQEIKTLKLQAIAGAIIVIATWIFVGIVA
ncbi:MAG: hypothetical protein ACI4QJ_02820 [Candidatus Spyradenecus sp.]